MILFKDFNGNVVSSVVQSRKLDFGKKIRTITISDLHSYTSNERRANRLAEEIKRLEPDVIFIAGDIFGGLTDQAHGGGAKQWEGSERLEKFKRFVQNISEVCPVCITLGNHDLRDLNDENKRLRERNFRNLEKLRAGVMPLYNDRVVVNGMEIIGFVPRLDLMEEAGLQTQVHGRAHDEFINDYEKNGVRFTNDPDHDLKTFLGHDPHLIAVSENGVGLGSLSVCDFFIAGHLHNGYKPLLSIANGAKKLITGRGLKGLELDKGYTEQVKGLVDKDGNYIKRTKKLWLGPTNLCRGIVYFDNNAQQRILQLPDGTFYKNSSSEQNVQVWEPILEILAREEVLKKKYHFMLISEGIAPSFIPRERLATVNIVDIEGTRRVKK